MEGNPGKRLTAHLHQPGADQLREAGDDGRVMLRYWWAEANSCVPE